MDVGIPNAPFRLDVSHVRYLHRLLSKLGVHGADAHDLAQTVLLNAHRASGSFRGTASANTWLYRICLRVVGHHRSATRARPVAPMGDRDLPSDDETPLDELLSKEHSLILQECLRALAPEQQEVWLMHDLEGLTMREVAERLGCPLQTAYSRLRAARHALGSASISWAVKEMARADTHG
jgi:RNA polymerase sigma-70 factor (ECF subfamily)